MEVLINRMHCWYFQWRHSLFGQSWVMATMGIVLFITLLIIQAHWHQQQLLLALQQTPVASIQEKSRVQSTFPTVASLIQKWPTEDEAERISAEILAQADAMGMVFERAEFQSLPVEHATLQIQRIKLPLKGDYLQVRQFLTQVLQTYPSMALSQFKLQRSDVMQKGVEAYVELSLYTRNREHT